MTTIIVTPNSNKMKILKENEEIKDLKFMTKNEYKSIYYFSYDEKALYYLMNKYHFNIDVCKVYLNNLYVIDINKDYKSPKLNFLKDLKIDLLNNNLLNINKLYQDYLKKHDIILKSIYNLDKYEEEMFNIKPHYELTKISNKVVECTSLEEEVNYVALEIIKLLNKGIDINKIYLTNVSDEYFYTLDKIFSYYKIPINIPYQYSIYSTKVINDYLTSGKIDLVDPTKTAITKKLLNILSNISFIDEEDPLFKTILIDELKDTFLDIPLKSNAINIKDLYSEEFKDDEYVFVLGFNQEVLPRLEKDIKYISDNEKSEVSLYTTNELNIISKNTLTVVLSKIKNLYLSYKLSSPFNSYYKSSLIDELNLEIIKPDIDTYQYSNIYNKLRLANKLDIYYLYGEKSNDLARLYTHYPIPYNTYSNKFTGINHDEYLDNLPYPLRLSYTSINSYSECKFKYYINSVLHLNPFTDSFEAYLGSMYHYILSIYQKTNFNFEEEYQKYLEKRNLSLKELLLLNRLKKDLLKLIDVLKEQENLTEYNEYCNEEQIDIELDKDVSVVFTGIIDRILYYEEIEDIYFSIIDYKSGTIDTHIEPMQYGLHMQLPVYLYLIHNSRKFTNPIFTGIYYQKILFDYPNYSKDLAKEEANKYLLQGYSTDNIEILSKFDTTYISSRLIKSMSYSNNDFGTYIKKKIINNDLLDKLINYTKNYISDTTDEILGADFCINPKVYNGENVACKYCKLKDLCYMTSSDLEYLEKCEDLSFLGGDDNA